MYRLYICFIYEYILLWFYLFRSHTHTHTHTHIYIYIVRPVWVIPPNYPNTVILRNACFHNMCCVYASRCRNNSVRMISDRGMSETPVSFLTPDTRLNRCQDVSVGTVTRYRLNDREIVVVLPAGMGDFTVL